MKTALVLVDIQNEYFHGGKRELVGPVEASLQAKQLLVLFREKHWPLVHIQHVSVQPGATAFLPNTDGDKIHENVQPLNGETVFQKNYPNSFRDTPLLGHLHDQQVERVVICGMMTHMCVDATTRAAFDYGFECLIAGDACATRALKFKDHTVPAEHVHMSFLAALEGTYGQVLNTKEIMERLKV